MLDKKGEEHTDLPLRFFCLVRLLRTCRPSSTSSLSKLAGAAAFPGLLLVNSVVSLEGGGAAAGSAAAVAGCGIVDVMSSV